MPDRCTELIEAVCNARARGTRPGIVGGGSRPWTGWAGTAIKAASHCGVVEHSPTELVATLRAGTPLAELDAVLAEHGQMLASECPDFGGSTIGGALATGWSGARAPFAGRLRDQVLGCRLINGRGELLRFGGQVMKNVAGYDVSRMLSGSQGRLGLVVELSLRLHPRPEAETTLEWDCRSLAELRTLVNRLLHAGEPLSGACWWDGVARLRFSARPATLRRLAAGSGGRAADDAVWQQLRTLSLPFFTAAGDPLWRLRVPPGRDLEALAGEQLYDQAGAVCWYRGKESLQQLEALLGPGRAVPLAEGPGRVLPVDGVAGRLQRQLCQAFDPDGVFTPVQGQG